MQYSLAHCITLDTRIISLSVLVTDPIKVIARFRITCITARAKRDLSASVAADMPMIRTVTIACRSSGITGPESNYRTARFATCNRPKYNTTCRITLMVTVRTAVTIRMT